LSCIYFVNPDGIDSAVSRPFKTGTRIPTRTSFAGHLPESTLPEAEIRSETPVGEVRKVYDVTRVAHDKPRRMRPILSIFFYNCLSFLVSA